MDEQSYTEGSRRAWLHMLQECLIHLGVSDVAGGQALWVMEREETIAKLREVCAAHGDNEWDDDLYIPDIIEKHLQHHLE